jgi:L-lactate dehydrogenase complex protein LldE
VDTGAQRFVTTDCGCLMNIDGYAEKNQKPVRGEHILSFLWSRTRGDGNRGEDKKGGQQS